MTSWEAKLNSEDKAKLQELRDNMELARLALMEIKTEFDRACDALYLFVRAHRESE